MKFAASLLSMAVFFPSSVAGEIVFSAPTAAMSSMRGQKAQPLDLEVKNAGVEQVQLAPKLIGAHAHLFRFEVAQKSIKAGGRSTVSVWLSPEAGKGEYEAKLLVGSSKVILHGVGLDAFEGKNEPSLSRIARAFEIELDVGGDTHSLPTNPPVIGDGIPARRFEGVTGKPVRIRPVARFSPKGNLPFGIIAGDGKLTEWGSAENSTVYADNHQRLWPRLRGGGEVVEKVAPEEPFAFFMKGHQYVSSTNPADSKDAPIKHTARVFPVVEFQGKAVEDAFLICFEEARNGDYQDCVFLVENVRVAD